MLILIKVDDHNNNSIVETRLFDTKEWYCDKPYKLSEMTAIIAVKDGSHYYIVDTSKKIDQIRLNSDLCYKVLTEAAIEYSRDYKINKLLEC